MRAILTAVLFLCLPAAVRAAIVVDGDFSLGEWDPVLERRTANNDVPWGPNNDLVTLSVSWDLSNVFIGVEGYSSANNVFFIYVDSSSRGTGAEQSDYYPGFDTQGEGWDPDFVHAVCEMEAGIGADVRAISVDGSTESVPGALHASRYGYHNTNGVGGWEISIPWSEIGLETGGWLKVAAGLGWATDRYDPQAPLGGGSGDELGPDGDGDVLSLDNPVQVFYDTDNDGVPDDARATADSVVVRFSFYAPNAAFVNLAGDFNDWCNPSGGVIDTGIDPMSDEDGDSMWTIDRTLPLGYQEYKFVENGSIWYSDPLNPDTNPNDNNNSILVVYDPLIYYVHPMEGEVVVTSRPLVSASIAHSEDTSLDLDGLTIYIDDQAVAGGPSYYDPVARTAAVTLVDSLEEGEHEVKFAVSNTDGEGHADSALFVVDLDFEAPQIVHVPLSDQPANSPVTVTAVMTDNKRITGAVLFYRQQGGFTYEAPFYEGLENTWYAEIPAGVVSDGATIEYHVTASDLVNTAREPVAGEHSFAVTGDDIEPVVGEHFASPDVISPDADGQDDGARISFRLSEPVYVDIDLFSGGGSPVRSMARAALFPMGYNHVVWDGTDSLGAVVPDGQYRYGIGGVDLAGLAADPAQGWITVDRSAPQGKLKVVLLFHANQAVNYQGDTANDVCFNGLVSVLRNHPSSRAMMHFSGSLLHDLQWFSFRHSPSTIGMLRDGAGQGQFEIVGSTYAQNVPYATHMWDNGVQVRVQREVIEHSLDRSPVSFWNAERCWKQQLVPLIAGNGYAATWVESHIIFDSGTSVPEHAVRKTRLGDYELVIFNDDAEMIWLLDYAIDSGDTDGLVSYLAYLHAEDTYRDFVVCYCEDAEAAGLWDYEHGYDPQPDWDNLDHVLDVLEGLDWVELTTFSDYLASHRAVEMIEQIVDGQANWMVGPSQSAGYDDWFDFNERSPLLAFYRDFFTERRSRVQALQESFHPCSPAGRLVGHALRSFAAHQFEFGCIGCGGFYCQDYHKMETLEAACLAAEYAASPVAVPEVLLRDANGDSAGDILLVTPQHLFVFTQNGGRLLYWYDLERGEQIVGNEIFMWGYYYLGWRDHYGGGNFNDDCHYMVDYEWDAPYHFAAAQPYNRTYGIRKKCFNEHFSFGGSTVDNLLNDEYNVSAAGDTVRFDFTSTDFSFTKSFYPSPRGLAVTYSVRNKRSSPRAVGHAIENSLNPSLVEVMDYGRESLKYYDGADTSSVAGPATTGVVNVITGTKVEYSFSPEPDDLNGRRDVFALSLNPSYDYTLSGGETMVYGFTLSAGFITGDGGEIPHAYPLRLYQNYPNPFNARTRITYSVAGRGHVGIRIYDVSGRLVRVLFEGVREPGFYSTSWDGRNGGGRPLGSGIYFCRMESGGLNQTKKLVLIR